MTTDDVNARAVVWAEWRAHRQAARLGFGARLLAIVARFSLRGRGC